MFQQRQNQPRNKFSRGLALTTTATLVAVALGAGPAAARPDAGPHVTRITYAGECLLARVGAQYVRCDNNTGNAVPAPVWIPER